MADERWNESRNQWDRERRFEREPRRADPRDDYGQTGRPYPQEPQGRDRAFGHGWPTDGAPGGYADGGRVYGGERRSDEMPAGYREYEANQRRRHHGDYNPDRYTPNPREGRGEEPRTWWNRTQDEVSSWFGDDEARRRREWDEGRAEAEGHGQHRGRGPTGYRRSDSRILDDINDRLTDDAYLDASAIEVQVKDGEVTLAGQIQRREDKRRAEDLAERVSGVTHVQNNLRLRTTPAEGPTTTDLLGMKG